jgi:iron complex outermembrane receptor protein
LSVFSFERNFEELSKFSRGRKRFDTQNERGAEAMCSIYQPNSEHRSSHVARSLSVSAAITLALLIGASAARAQQSGASEAAPQGKEEIGEIIVTARRREERIQDVPISITALPQEALENNNIQDYEQLQFKVPAVSVQTASTSRDLLQFTIRGQGAVALGSQPGVSVYFDEVPIITSFDGYIGGGPGTLFDLENVQILKGPQGTLFGRNTTGGAVLLQSARPKDELV